MVASRVLLRLLLVCLLASLLSACGTSNSRKGGGYYQDDGPEANPPSNLDAVPNAVPKIEPFASGANKPYTTLGKSYVPDTSGGPYRERGIASWYGKKFHGHQTSNGERYDMYAMTAAHKTLPIPSYVKVTRVANGKTVILRVNDRGPFHEDRIIDLSYVAAYKLGLLAAGSAEVIVERITPDQIRNWDGNDSAVATAMPVAPPPPPPAPSPQTPSPQTTDTSPRPYNYAPTNPSSANTPSSSTPMSNGTMFLQAGAFSDQSKAQALADKLNGQVTGSLGYPVFVERTPTNLYRVRIGPFASRNDASAAIGPIQSATGLTPSLTTP